jgi:hypothetical protein
MWIPDEKRTKLDAKRKKMMITGYNDNHKVYKLVDLDTNKVSFSRDFVDEEIGPFRTYPRFKIIEQPWWIRIKVSSFRKLHLKGEKIMSMRSLLGRLFMMQIS